MGGKQGRLSCLLTIQEGLSSGLPNSMQVSLKKPLPFRKQNSFMSNVKHEVQMLRVAAGDRGPANE